tara:strand:+ start:1289 stop:1843 length:555 start_codon:yes stop_codon:yes gene_type:complete
MLKKTAIRKHFAQLIKSNLTIFDNRVFGGRISKYERDELYPAVSIYNRNDTVDENFTDHTLRSMEMDIIIAVQHNETSTLDNYDFDEIVENTQEEVEMLINRIVSVDNLAEDPFKLIEEIAYTSSTTSFNSDSSDNIGYANISYSIKYRASRSIDLGTLVDFDEIGSIENIDIINLRPLQGLNP